jgi:pimeloyl-ACP methyl ester carboxylesterase
MADSTGAAPVLFLHSLGGTAGHWQAQIQHLMPERMGLAVDLPGHGISDPVEAGDYAPAAVASEIGSTIDALQLAPLVLVGHSYGAAVAVALLAERPRDVAGILLVDPGSDLRLEPPEEIAEFLGSLESSSYQKAIRAHYEAALTGGSETTRDRVLKVLVETPREVVVGALSSLPSFDAVTPLLGFEGPALSVIAAQHDGPAALHRVVPSLPVRVLSGVSHWLHMDEPEAFNALLDEFLERVDDA